MPSSRSNTSIFQNAARVAFEASRQVSASIAASIHGPFADYSVDHSKCMYVGPWEVKRATSKKKSGGFCVWSFDKISYGKTYNLGQHLVDRIFELCRKDAKQCTLLRHPCVLRIVEPVHETKNKISFVSEGVKMTLAALHCDMSGTLSIDSNSTAVFHSTLTSTNVSEVEIKFGLICVCEAVIFLHEQARLIHLSISPQSVLIGDDNNFKVAGFQHCQPLNSGEKPEFNFAGNAQNSHTADHPLLEWTAPELVDAWTLSCSHECDSFSFALLSLWLLRGERLIPCGCSLDVYNKIMGKWSIGFRENERMPNLLTILQQQLSIKPCDRPSMSECLAHLSQDENIQALLFMKNNANKTIEQKNAFLHACLQGPLLPQLGKNLTSSFLAPFTIDCLKTEALHKVSVRILMRICDKVDNVCFQSIIAPVIHQLLQSRNESDIEEIATNVKTIPRFPGSDGEEMVLAILKASVDKLYPAKQKAVLENIGGLALSYPTDIKQKFCMVYIHTCAKTESGQVRLICLRNLYRCSDSLTPAVSSIVFDNVEKIAQVDTTSQTSAAIARLVEGLCAHSTQFSSKRGLPFLTPMLSNESLNMDDFQVIYCAIEKILSRIRTLRIGESSMGKKVDDNLSDNNPISMKNNISIRDRSLNRFDDTVRQNQESKTSKPVAQCVPVDQLDPFEDLL